MCAKPFTMPGLELRLAATPCQSDAPQEFWWKFESWMGFPGEVVFAEREVGQAKLGFNVVRGFGFEIAAHRSLSPRIQYWDSQAGRTPCSRS